MTTSDPRIEFFDTHAANWDESGPPLNEILDRLTALRPRLGLATGQDVLEVGCGTGQVTGWLLDALGETGSVTAVDFSARMISRAQARAPQARFLQADVCDADFGAGAFDLIWCMHCFPHFRCHRAALQNLTRALRPAGQLVVLHLNNWQAINAIHTRLGGIVAEDLLPPPDDWPALLREAGLAPTALVDEPDLFLVVARLLRVAANPA